MSILQNYLMDKLVFENHPAIDASMCADRIQTRTGCQVCRAVCPQGVFEDGAPDWSLCDGCGVCAARCPTRAMRPTSLLSEKLLDLAGQETVDAVLSCERQEGSADLKAPCLAALPWEYLAFLTLRGHLTLLCSGCADCPRRTLAVEFEKTLTELRVWMGAERFSERVTVLRTRGEAAPTRLSSRREAVSRLFTRSKSFAAALLPQAEELMPDGMLARRLLFHSLKRMASDAPVSSQNLPQFTEFCDACGVCVKLCPTKALHRLDGERQERRAVWHMALIPWRCTDCGLCIAACPKGGLTRESRTATITQPLIHSVSGQYCRRCGSPAGAEELCDACRAEMNRPVEF